MQLQSKISSKKLIEPRMKIINVIDEVWMCVHRKYVMSWIMGKLHPIEKNCSYTDVTDGVLLNWQNNEQE